MTAPRQPSRGAFLLAKRLLFPGIDVATRERRRFIRYFRPGPVRTLDVGCGNGAFSLAAYRLGNDVLGVDLNPENIARSREYAAYVGANPARLRFEVANLHDLAGRGDRFDQIIAFEILEHLIDDAGVISSLAGMLTPSGVLHVSSPYLHRRPYVGEVLSETEDGGHVRLGYTVEGLEELFRAAGLTPGTHATAVGPLSRRVLELVNASERRLGRLGGVGAWLVGLPLVLLERVTLPDGPAVGRALIVYAQGVKSKADP